MFQAQSSAPRLMNERMMSSPYMSLARAYEVLGSSVVLSSGGELKSVHALRNPEWFGLDAEEKNPAVMVDRYWPKKMVSGRMLIEVSPRSWPQDTALRQHKTDRLLAFLRKYTGAPVGIVFAEYPRGGDGSASKIVPRPDLVAIVKMANRRTFLSWRWRSGDWHRVGDVGTKQ